MVSEAQLIMVLSLATGLVALSGRRLGVLGLALQFMLCALLLSDELLPIVLIARLVLGMASSLILFISAASLARAQRRLAEVSVQRLERMGSLFGLLCVALAGFVSAGIYRAVPWLGLSPANALTASWLILSGLILATTESSVLGQGLALMTALNGFEVAFFQHESGLLMIGMFGLLELGLVLMIAVLSEQQLESLYPPEAV